jgi:hypothetical protein
MNFQFKLLKNKVSVLKEFLPDEDTLTLMRQTFTPDVHGVSEITKSLHIITHEDVPAALVGFVD